MAVSYTHLPLDNGAIFQGGGGFILSDGGDLGVIVIEAALELVVPAPDIQDVYKRQTMTYLEHCHYRGVDGAVIACVDFNDPQVVELVNSDEMCIRDSLLQWFS